MGPEQPCAARAIRLAWRASPPRSGRRRAASRCPLPLTAGGQADLQFPKRRLIRRAGDG
jgi:hypothetical protein